MNIPFSIQLNRFWNQCHSRSQSPTVMRQVVGVDQKREQLNLFALQLPIQQARSCRIKPVFVVMSRLFSRWLIKTSRFGFFFSCSSTAEQCWSFIYANRQIGGLPDEVSGSDVERGGVDFLPVASPEEGLSEERLVVARKNCEFVHRQKLISLINKIMFSMSSSGLYSPYPQLPRQRLSPHFLRRDHPPPSSFNILTSRKLSPDKKQQNLASTIKKGKVRNESPRQEFSRVSNHKQFQTSQLLRNQVQALRKENERLYRCVQQNRKKSENSDQAVKELILSLQQSQDYIQPLQQKINQLEQQIRRVKVSKPTQSQESAESLKAVISQLKLQITALTLKESSLLDQQKILTKNLQLLSDRYYKHCIHSQSTPLLSFHPLFQNTLAPKTASAQVRPSKELQKRPSLSLVFKLNQTILSDVKTTRKYFPPVLQVAQIYHQLNDKQSQSERKCKLFQTSIDQIIVRPQRKQTTADKQVQCFKQIKKIIESAGLTIQPTEKKTIADKQVRCFKQSIKIIESTGMTIRPTEQLIAEKQVRYLKQNEESKGTMEQAEMSMEQCQKELMVDKQVQSVQQRRVCRREEEVDRRDNLNQKPDKISQTLTFKQLKTSIDQIYLIIQPASMLPIQYRQMHSLKSLKGVFQQIRLTVEATQRQLTQVTLQSVTISSLASQRLQNLTKDQIKISVHPTLPFNQRKHLQEQIQQITNFTQKTSGNLIRPLFAHSLLFASSLPPSSIHTTLKGESRKSTRENVVNISLDLRMPQVRRILNFKRQTNQTIQSEKQKGNGQSQTQKQQGVSSLNRLTDICIFKSQSSFVKANPVKYGVQATASLSLQMNKCRRIVQQIKIDYVPSVKMVCDSSQKKVRSVGTQSKSCQEETAGLTRTTNDYAYREVQFSEFCCATTSIQALKLFTNQKTQQLSIQLQCNLVQGKGRSEELQLSVLQCVSIRPSNKEKLRKVSKLCSQLKRLRQDLTLLKKDASLKYSFIQKLQSFKNITHKQQALRTSQSLSLRTQIKTLQEQLAAAHRLKKDSGKLERESLAQVRVQGADPKVSKRVQRESDLRGSDLAEQNRSERQVQFESRVPANQTIQIKVVKQGHLQRLREPKKNNDKLVITATSQTHSSKQTIATQKSQAQIQPSHKLSPPQRNPGLAKLPNSQTSQKQKRQIESKTEQKKEAGRCKSKAKRKPRGRREEGEEGDVEEIERLISIQNRLTLIPNQMSAIIIAISALILIFSIKNN